jgi:hypothetical protein
MIQIKKMRADHVIDFAAEELKKYLRMMMPRCGEIEILYQPDATDGFRLGLLEDFGIESEAEDPVLDDVVHIDTTAEGGILAGSNMRSILYAVYRLLKLHGCRWLYPGVDGEYIPITDLKPQKYHKMADSRFRGHCNEGSEYQQCMLETIDFFPKQEINVYMLEFDIPFIYYNRYYMHEYNKNRPAEPVNPQLVLQWKRQCEAEIAKRGLMFHDMGHGWTAEPYGIPSTKGWNADTDIVLTEKQQSYVAMLNGVRGLRAGVPLNTNVCMSNPEVRQLMVDCIVDYAEKSSNVDYLHVWLADGTRNHCECEECQKMRPSDYYLMIMNELDEALTAKGLDTRIVFIAYVDTLFAPEHITIKNPQRFSLLYAPIHRTYTASVNENSVIPEPLPYERNNWETPKAAEVNLALLRAWQENWKGPSFEYEYHFWRAHLKDPGGQYIARRIYEDIRGLNFMGLDGVVEDGSQRHFFPNGFAMHIYAATLLDHNCDYEAELEDYFSHVYGEDWRAVREYLQKVSDLFDIGWMYGEKRVADDQSAYYDPARWDLLEKAQVIAAEGKALAEAHLAMPTRPQTVSYRLLLRHAEYILGVAACMAEKAKGNDELAQEKGMEFFHDFGRYEFEIERYYDHELACRTLHLALKQVVKLVGDAAIQ